MGTNYYLTRDTCSHCGDYDRVWHLGKSSGGWTFSFRGYRDELGDQTPCGHCSKNAQVRDFDEWQALIVDWLARGGQIRNEYGDIKTLPEMLELVEAKKGDENHVRTFPDDGVIDQYGHGFSFNEFS